jgi:hypothetical protein
MTQYRTRDVEVSAVQVLNADYNGVDFDGAPFSDMPEWLVRAFKNERIVISTKNHTDYAEFLIKKLEGDILITPGDWIIFRPVGELIPMQGHIFEKLFKKVVEDE